MVFFVSDHAFSLLPFPPPEVAPQSAGRHRPDRAMSETAVALDREEIERRIAIMCREIERMRDGRYANDFETAYVFLASFLASAPWYVAGLPSIGALVIAVGLMLAVDQAGEEVEP